MMKFRINTLWLVAPVLLLSGCELLQTKPAEDPVLVKLAELERRLQSIERVMHNQSLVNLTQQVSAAERRGDELQGRVEELEHNVESAGERQRQLYVDLDTRIQELEASIKAWTAAICRRASCRFLADRIATTTRLRSNC